MVESLGSPKVAVSTSILILIGVMAATERQLLSVRYRASDTEHQTPSMMFACSIERESMRFHLLNGGFAGRTVQVPTYRSGD